MGSAEVVPERLNRQSEWFEHCPLRDRRAPEYQLLLSTIREEIASAIENANKGRNSMIYQRLNTLLLTLAIVVGSAAWIWH
jgi:hypothetical protein